MNLPSSTELEIIEENRMNNLSQYSKTLAAVAGVLALAGNALANGNVGAAEAGALVTAVLAAYGVYKIRNRPVGASGVARLRAGEMVIPRKVMEAMRRGPWHRDAG